MTRRRLVVAALAAATVAACAVTRPPVQGDPTAPVLIRGRVVDAAGRGFGGNLGLVVLDAAHSQAGQPVPVLFSRDFTTAQDGAFELRLAVEPALGRAAAVNGGYVNFQLMTFTATGQPMFPFSFPRQVAAGTWVGDPPHVEIGPTGFTDLDSPAVTVPPPAP